jgi:alpha-mannosidase
MSTPGTSSAAGCQAGDQPPFTYFVISHTHWDREWYQPFQEFRIRLVRLVDHLLDLLDDCPDYRYFMLDGQTVVLEDYLAVRPDRESDLRRHIQAGRILVGPWYILPDEFLVSPESLVRNLLLGHRIAQRFGAVMPVGYIPDTFGHISQLPQIFRGFGLDCAAVWRGLPPLPTEFTWQSPDGSGVLVVNLREGYSDLAWAPADPAGFTAAVRLAAGKLRPYTTTPNLLLTDGNDHLEARAGLPVLLAAANALLESGPEAARLVHSTLPQYIAAVRAASPRLQTVAGEFRCPRRNNILPGVLSARLWIKQRNRSTETLLTRWAEPFSAIAASLAPEPSGSLQPESRAGLLDEAWRLLLQNQPHDSICGCSIDQVHEEMRVRFDQAGQIGETIASQSLAAIAARVNTSASQALGPIIPITVFNPSTHAADDSVSVQVQIPSGWSGFRLEDEAGRLIPHRVTSLQELPFSILGIDETAIINRIGSGMEAAERLAGQSLISLAHQVEGPELVITAVLAGHGLGDRAAIAATAAEIQQRLAQEPGLLPRIKVSLVPYTGLSFVARGVPGCGFATYFVHSLDGSSAGRPGTSQPPDQLAPCRAEVALEVGQFRLSVDIADGTLTLLDECTGATYPGLNRFVDDGDRGDEYNFCPVESDTLVSQPSRPPTIRLVEDSPDRRTVEISLLYRIPVGLDSSRRARASETVEMPIVTRITLTSGLPRLDIETTLTNTASDHRLRVALPTPIKAATWRTEAPFDIVERPVTPPGFEAAPEYLDWHERPVAQQPQLEFCDVSGGGAGLMLANRGLPEVEAQRAPGGAVTLFLTLLRCVGWLSRDDLSTRRGHAGPGLPTPGAQCPGQHTVHYSLIPHHGDWPAALPHARSFSAPLRAVTGSAHPGSLPPRHSFLTVEPRDVFVSALKTAENGQGLVLRLWNAAAEPRTATVRLALPLDSASTASLSEQPGAAIPLDAGGSFTIPLRPRQAATILLRTGAIP